MVKIGIIGWGNVGRGVFDALKIHKEMELVGVQTKRAKELKASEKGIPFSPDILPKKPQIVILCGRSEDIPQEAVNYVQKGIATVDSFDMHAHILEHFKKMDAAAKAAKTVSVISAGWDPGVFSYERVFGDAFLPHGISQTFWGKPESEFGVSMGHSTAVRRMPGVADARQYTVPIGKTVDLVLQGKAPANLTAREKHRRVVYVVTKPDGDKKAIEAQIKASEYFRDYNTTVNFITQDEMNKKHTKLAHAGIVSTTAKTNDTDIAALKYELQLDSNPGFTAFVLVACAVAITKLLAEQKYGAYTMLDIPPAYYTTQSHDELLLHKM